MPARPATRGVKKPAKQQTRPVARKPKETRAVPAKVKISARVTVKPKGPVPKRVAEAKQTIRVKPKVPTRRLTAAERAEMKKFGALLLAERARLLVELEEIESRTARTTDAERATELSSYEDHPADLASETFEREKDLAIAESVESLLNQVNTALEKVERGTYGVCDACGRPIKRARLQALPFATLCLDCQGRLEG